MESREGGSCGVLIFYNQSVLLLFDNVEEVSIIKLDSSKLDAIALGIQISLGLLVVK